MSKYNYNTQRSHGDIEICGMSEFKNERDVAVFVYLDACCGRNEKVLQLCVYADRSSRPTTMFPLHNPSHVRETVLMYNETTK